MTLQILDEDDVRHIAREEMQRPQFVHQRTVAHVAGLPGRAYLRAHRAGAFPTTVIQRLVLARTADVLAYVERQLKIATTPAANGNADPESLTLARVGARRVSR